MDEAWYCDLTTEQKVIFEYMWAKADCAGVWSVNKRLAEIHLGSKFDWQAFGAACGARLVELDVERWMFRDFLVVNYEKLSRECRAHIPVFKALDRHRIPISDSYCEIPDSYPDSPDSTRQDKTRRKEVQEETISTPTLSEVMDYGTGPNGSVPPDVCEIWWNEHEARPRHASGGYTDKSGCLVFDWRAALRGYGQKWRNNDGQRRHNGAGATRPKNNGVPSTSKEV